MSKKPLYYLATAYTKHPSGRERAFTEACMLQVRLRTQHALRVFSPIAYMHNIARSTGLNGTDHEFWMECCRPFMRASDILLVAKMQGWNESRGIAEEIEAFKAMGKQIGFLNVETLAIEDAP